MSAHHSGPWSEPNNVEMLRKLKAQGWSADRIAKFFRAAGLAVTRSAVIGKCHRLGLCEEDKSPARIAARKSAARRNSALVQKRLNEGVPKKFPKAEPYREHGAERTAASVPHMDRDTRQCPTFVTGESGALGLVCGQPATHGSWCERCATQLIYTGRFAAEGIAA